MDGTTHRENLKANMLEGAKDPRPRQRDKKPEPRAITYSKHTKYGTISQKLKPLKLSLQNMTNCSSWRGMKTFTKHYKNSLWKIRLFFCWRFNHGSVSTCSHDHFSYSRIEPPFNLFFKKMRLVAIQLSYFQVIPLVGLTGCVASVFLAAFPSSKDHHQKPDCVQEKQNHVSFFIYIHNRCQWANCQPIKLCLWFCQGWSRVADCHM